MESEKQHRASCPPHEIARVVGRSGMTGCIRLLPAEEIVTQHPLAKYIAEDAPDCGVVCEIARQKSFDDE